MLSEREDAFSPSFLELHRTGSSQLTVERDDGYFDTFRLSTEGRYDSSTWTGHEQESMRRAHGRVLDIGCGDGRHALRLQTQGLEVAGIDNSPLAIQVCEERGLRRSAVVAMTQLGKRLFGRFDTLSALGNNFCMFGRPERARRLLCRLHGMTSGDATLFAQARNRRAGKMSGQACIRARYAQ